MLSVTNLPEPLQMRLTDNGVPSVISSDRGTEFNNSVMDALCLRLNIDHRSTAAYHPSANGAGEAAVKVVKRLLQKTALLKLRHWDMLLPAVQAALNQRLIMRTKTTPFAAMFGRPFSAVAPEHEGPTQHWLKSLDLLTSIIHPSP